jgi:hypothetical protein
MKIRDLAIVAANRAWRVASEQSARRDRVQAQKLRSRGTYLEYDADRERHRVQTADGEILEGESITNAGLAAGDEVAVSGADSLPRFKAMPR